MAEIYSKLKILNKLQNGSLIYSQTNSLTYNAKQTNSLLYSDGTNVNHVFTTVTLGPGDTSFIVPNNARNITGSFCGGGAAAAEYNTSQMPKCAGASGGGAILLDAPLGPGTSLVLSIGTGGIVQNVSNGANGNPTTVTVNGNSVTINGGQGGTIPTTTTNGVGGLGGSAPVPTFGGRPIPGGNGANGSDVAAASGTDGLLGTAGIGLNYIMDHNNGASPYYGYYHQLWEYRGIGGGGSYGAAGFTGDVNGLDPLDGVFGAGGSNVFYHYHSNYSSQETRSIGSNGGNGMAKISWTY